MEELGAILVVVLADPAVQEVPEVVQEVQGGTPGSSKKVNFVCDGGLVSSPPSFQGVISWG